MTLSLGKKVLSTVGMNSKLPLETRVPPLRYILRQMLLLTIILSVIVVFVCHGNLYFHKWYTRVVRRDSESFTPFPVL